MVFDQGGLWSLIRVVFGLSLYGKDPVFIMNCTGDNFCTFSCGQNAESCECGPQSICC